METVHYSCGPPPYPSLSIAPLEFGLSATVSLLALSTTCHLLYDSGTES